MSSKKIMSAAAILLMGLTVTACGKSKAGTASNELENGAAAIQDAMAMMNTEKENQSENERNSQNEGNSQDDRNAQNERSSQDESNNSKNQITQGSDDLRRGTSEDTVATPDDFPEAYDYGTGKIQDYSRDAMLRKMPAPSGNNTVLNTEADPTQIQVLYLWEEGNVPAKTDFTSDMIGYFDDWDFRPYVTAIPVREGVQPKGAVVLMAGGAYQFRGNYTDSLPTAAALRELGFQTFIVDYRLSPYSQEEGALDVARAVRFVRKNADVYGIDPDDIAVMGFSAGGIQAGEFLMHYDEEVNGTALDDRYVPDELDEVLAHASAAGMIYSFYHC